MELEYSFVKDYNYSNVYLDIKNPEYQSLQDLSGLNIHDLKTILEGMEQVNSGVVKKYEFCGRQVTSITYTKEITSIFGDFFEIGKETEIESNQLFQMVQDYIEYILKTLKEKEERIANKISFYNPQIINPPIKDILVSDGVYDKEIVIGYGYGTALYPYGGARFSRIRRLKWMNEERLVTVDFLSDVHPYPTVDLKYMIVISHPVPHRNNKTHAFLYNAQGQLVRQLLPPVLLSSTALQQSRKVTSDIRRFSQVYDIKWKYNRENILVTSATIVYLNGYYEERVYDADKNVYGEVLGEGKL